MKIANTLFGHLKSDLTLDEIHFLTWSIVFKACYSFVDRIGVGDTELRDSDNVVHYVKPSLVLRNGRASGDAFRLRSGEVGWSINWLECFEEYTKDDQLVRVRSILRIETKKNGRLAELNVQNTKLTTGATVDLRFKLCPLPADHNYPADPSHCEVIGMPPYESPKSALVGDLMAKSVTATHLAKLNSTP